MGIKGLFHFLKRFEQDVDTTKYVSDLSVGIDMFWFLHRSKGDMFYLQNFLLPIIKNAAKVYCIFDGRPSPEKREMLQQQAAKRKEILQSIEQIEKFLKYPFNHLTGADRHYINTYIVDLKRQAWQPPSEYVDYVKSWLLGKGCEIYQADGEADDLLIDLEKSGEISLIITNDSDLLALGSQRILRPNSPMRGAVFEREHLCTNLGFTAGQWCDFMYLCKHMQNTDILLAYSFIRVYKDLDYVLQKYNILYSDELIL
jgi:5'-3' exonuclease